jgi:hypothetical protein
MNQHFSTDPPYLKWPFNVERSVIQKITMPTHEGDVIKLGNPVEKLLIDIVSGENLRPISDRDKKRYTSFWKKDRIVVDQFDRFNDIIKVLSFESSLKGYVSTATLIDRDAFRKATTNPVSADDSFANLHPLVRVQVLFQNEHNIRSSIVNGRKRSLLLYNHLLDVGHVNENGSDQVGFCTSYYSEVDNRGA